VLLAELLIVVGGWVFSPSAATIIAAPLPTGSVTNTAALGAILYTRYAFFFEIAGMVLLVAMIGAIVLTLRHKAYVRRQSISAQVSRDPALAIEVRKVPSGRGLS
jgi:NADH-quinone oxidoreductase subunit J